MTRSHPRYQPGDRIADRYQVHDVKMGGMGEVYLCLDLEEMYPLALKTFQQRYQSDALRQAFEMEVATWVALEKHPNIVRCFYMETLDNQPFMILEWIGTGDGRGTDLRSHLRCGPMDLNQSLKVILDICYGLQHAQDKQPGLVHRDLKPENILVAQGGQAKITDFGLAQILTVAEVTPDTDALVANAGQTMMSRRGIAGTPSYMAPEQWRGETLDSRTDIYALGCIWVELLTGQPPFRLDYQPITPQELKQWLSDMQHQHEHAKRPGLVMDAPAAVNELIQYCLAPDQAKRTAHLTNLIAQVQALYQTLLNETPPPPPISGEMTVADYNNRGVTYQDIGQFDNAWDDFNQATILDPSNAMAYSNRGATYADLAQFDNALTDYTKAISLDPSFANAYSNRGNTYAALGQFDNALLDHNQAISLSPSNAGAYFNRGKTYANLSQFDNALQDYTQAISLDPCYARAYHNRGVTHEALGQFDNALFDFNQTIALDPSNAMAYSNRGLCYHILGQFNHALLDFDQAISLAPSYTSALFNRGVAYEALGQFDNALQDYTQAISLDPNQAKAYSNRGRIYADLGQFDNALQDYTQAISLDPNYANAYVNLGALLGNQRKFEEALPYFEKAAQLGDPIGAQYVAQASRMLGQPPETETNPEQVAIDAFTQATSLDEMRQAVTAHPVLLDASFIEAITQAIAEQVPVDQQPTYQQRLSWLQQIIREQAQ